MAKKQFKTESKRILDLMINSIYTHKEIFLRELISNASDAVDKLAYRALTDDQVGLSRSDFEIRLAIDEKARTLTVSDNGIGMTKEELEENLGVIAKSGSLDFKKDMDAAAGDVDIIGQFGVGFYAAFMVSDKVTVVSRAYGSDEAWQWESAGADGYTVKPAARAAAGTDVILTIKPDAEEADYSRFLGDHAVAALVKKYSDYIRYPIRMEMEKTRKKPDSPEESPEWETYRETETLNSMVPLWQRPKKDVTAEDLANFYKEHFGDWEEPAASVQVSAEGTVEYKALLFIPSHAPYDFYTRDFEKGLQLYSSGVMIMEKCADLVPEHFRFARGVVDSQDFSLNISREMLQHTRELKVISTNLEKKIKTELLRLLTDEREKYEKFYAAFGRQLKYGVAADYGAHKEILRDLLLFASSASEKMTTLHEYVTRMKEGQPAVYFAAGENAAQLGKLPQAERILAAGYEILYLTEEVDEFVMQMLGEEEGKPFKSVGDDDALPETDEEKAEAERRTEENRAVLDFVQETLGDKIKAARISKKLVSHPVCMTTDGPITLEMEKYFKAVGGELGGEAPTAERVLELNAEAPAFEALRRALETDKEKAAKYARILYAQSLLIAGLPLEDPTEYTDLIADLMK